MDRMLPRRLRWASLILLAAAGVRAAEAPKGGPDSDPAVRNEIMQKAVQMYSAGGEGGPDPKMEVEHYTRSLGLNKKQQAALLKILQDKQKVFRSSGKLQRSIQEQVEALHKRIHELNAAFRVDFKAASGRLEAFGARFRALLRPEQQTRFDAMEAERVRAERDFQRRQESEWRRSHGGQGPKDGQGRHADEPPPEAPQSPGAPGAP